MAGRSLQSLISDGMSEITLPELSVEYSQTVYTGLNAPIEEQKELEEENANTITELRKTDSLYSKRRQTASGADSVFDDEKTARATRGRRTSSTSGVTSCPPTPFHGFVPPEMTVVPDKKSPVNKKSFVVSFRAAIPVMPLPVAVLCLILNIFVPGLGTVLSGLVSICTTKGDVSNFDRVRILCMNCWVGLMQLGTVVFLAIGWVWSIVWGCAMVGLADSQRLQSYPIDTPMDSSA